jgi:YbbR domain-containing protein
MIERIRRIADTGSATRMLFSLLLAFTLWAWVTKQHDPEKTFHAANVPVETRNKPPGLEVVGSIPAVNVTLKGPQSVIRRVDASTVHAYVDLSNITDPGSYTRAVKVSSLDGLRRKDASPKTVTIAVDTVVSKSFKVEAQPPDNVPRNLSVTSTIASPEDVTVTGVQQNVDRVAHVLADVVLDNHQESFSTQVVPRAVDANMQEVDNVDVSPSTVGLSVSIEVRGKEIPVFVRFSGNAAEGYEVVGEPQSSPSTVLVDGQADALAKVQYIYTTPVDTSTLTAPTFLPAVPLDTSTLPAGVNIETLTVDVSVRVDRTAIPRTFDGVPVSVINLAAGASAVSNPATVSVTVRGPQEEINALTAGDISVVVNANNLGPGTFSVVPRVVLPPRLSYDALSQVSITISARVATPTPTSTPTSQPSPPVAPTGTSATR